jgi:hypothetical protein
MSTAQLCVLSLKRSDSVVLHLVLLPFWTLPTVLYSKMEHDVLGSGSTPILKRWECPQLSLLERANPNHWASSEGTLHLRMGSKCCIPF